MREGLLALLLVPVLLTPAAAAEEPPMTQVQRGEYLVAMLGCGRCHTEGMLMGRQTGPWLAGSRLGIAWTPYQEDDKPGVVFPSNLTNDPDTGLGNWSEKDIVAMLTRGVDHMGAPASPVMPWTAYSLLRREDATDIAVYLKSLEGVDRAIPDAVAPGSLSGHAWIRFSVHLFDPKGEWKAEHDRVLPFGSTQ